LTVVEAWTLETHKTKAFRRSLGALDGETRTFLLVENSPSVNLERASRNLEGVTLIPTTQLDAYDLMRHDRLLLSREAALRLSRGLSAAQGDGAGEPIQAEGANAAAAREGSEPEGAEKTAQVKAKAVPKAANKPAARAKKKEKPAAKRKAKKG
jgi:hypothetical protein